ncbi:permease [Geobacillus sp. C56-T2]|uniref:permease n=1 Tax=Geobacillus sp. C56-T2 TaxID=600773 RepID=UPI0011A23413|nr:permease [Geobacillus sp. C56-T2]NNV07234.1 permease [Geobacillus sp. MMMUD3]TWG30502.1 hypothetical protein GC56T2_1652 [Geobacillus sp. C56-T2]
MRRLFSSMLIDMTGIVVIGVAAYLIVFSQWFGGLWAAEIPDSFRQFVTIFLSMVIEALPFVLIGVIVAGAIQIFVTEEHIRRWIPAHSFKAVAMGCVVGALFPACECGIVPIVRKLVSKGVPLGAAVGFLLTGPLINPIVILSTYMAFGNDATIAGWRMGLGFAAALLIAWSISLFFSSNQLRRPVSLPVQRRKSTSLFYRFEEMLKHSIDEFFDTGKYLMIGACVAAWVQTHVHTESLLLFGGGDAGEMLTMMGLAYFLSLCSEADAFIAASFRNIFSTSSILAFLIYGPMIDLKNTIMLFNVFRARFVVVLLMLVTAVVWLSVWVANMIQGW